MELDEYAKREGLTITEKFVESKSSKQPGRTGFILMLSMISDSAEPIGILAWHSERLARNSVDLH